MKTYFQGGKEAIIPYSVGGLMLHGANPEIFKNSEYRNFKTVIYIKVYIFGLETSQRIYFDIKFH